MLIDFIYFFLSFFVQSAWNQMLPGAVTYIIIYFQNFNKEMSTHFSKHVSCSIPSHIIDIYLKHSQNGWYFEWNTRRKPFVCSSVIFVLLNRFAKKWIYYTIQFSTVSVMSNICVSKWILYRDTKSQKICLENISTENGTHNLVFSVLLFFKLHLY